MDLCGEGLWRSFIIVAIIFLNLPKYGVASYYEAPLPYRQYALNATDLPCGSEVEVKPGEKYLFDSASAIVYESSLYASQSYSSRRRKRATKQDQKQSSKLDSSIQDGPSSTKFKILQGRSQAQARGVSHGGPGSGGYGGGHGGEGHYAGGGGYGYPIKPSVCQWTYFAGEDCSLEMHIIRFKPGDLNCYKQEFSVSDNHTEFKLCGYQKLYPGFRAETPVLYIKYWKLPYTYRHVFKGYVTCVGRSQNPTYDDSHQYFSPADAVEMEEVEAIEAHQEEVVHQAQTLDEFMAQEGLSVKKASEDVQDSQNAEEEINVDEEELSSLDEKIKGHSHQQLDQASETEDEVEEDVTGQEAVVHAESPGKQKKGVAEHARKETLEDKIKKFERQNSQRLQRARAVAVDLSEDVAIVELVQEEIEGVDQVEAESETVDDVLQQVDKHAVKQTEINKDEAINVEPIDSLVETLGDLLSNIGNIGKVEAEEDAKQVEVVKMVSKSQPQLGTVSKTQRLGLGSRSYYEDVEVDSYNVPNPATQIGYPQSDPYAVPQPQQYGYSYPTVMYGPAPPAETPFPYYGQTYEGSVDPSYYSPVPAAYPYNIPTNEAPVSSAYSPYGSYPQPIPVPPGPVEPSYNYNVPVQQPPINPGMPLPYVQNGPQDYSQYSQLPVQPPFPYEYQPNPPQPQGYQGPMPAPPPYEPVNNYGYQPQQYPPAQDPQYGAPQYQNPTEQSSYYPPPPNEGPTYSYSSPSAQGPVLYPQQQAPEYQPAPGPMPPPPPPPYPAQYPVPAPSPAPPQLGYDYLMASAQDPSLNYIVSCDLPYPQPCTPLSITPVNVYSPQAHPPPQTAYNSPPQSQPVTYG